MSREVKVDAYVYGSVIYDVCAAAIYTLVQLISSKSNVLFLALRACDKVDDVG